LFQSPVKNTLTRPKKPPNLLKITKPTEPVKPKAVIKGREVRKQVAKATIVKNREGKGGQARSQEVQIDVQNLIKTSLRKRKIRPTLKSI
jgi:hypothetical protein